MFNQNFNIMNGNYPLGAEFDPRAPFNQPEPIEKHYDVKATATLMCETSVTSEDAYYDEDGELCEENVNLEKDFQDQYYDPHGLLVYLGHLLEDKIKSETNDRHKKLLEKLRRDCRMWTATGEDGELYVKECDD